MSTAVEACPAHVHDTSETCPIGGGLEYRIKWRGWGSRWNTWEPERHIIDQVILTEWEEIHVDADSEEFSEDGSVVQVRDIGRVELGASNYTSSATYQDRPAALIGIFRRPDSNALQVANEVQACPTSSCGLRRKKTCAAIGSTRCALMEREATS